mmetsp:Transcript_24434/g.46303  ORF Transcript_24434/g.46303 Transcript_24434/m.46303 type:complete len:321 (-) Transcript_24434:3403-4365(-)
MHRGSHSSTVRGDWIGSSAQADQSSWQVHVYHLQRPLAGAQGAHPRARGGDALPRHGRVGPVRHRHEQPGSGPGDKSVWLHIHGAPDAPARARARLPPGRRGAGHGASAAQRRVEGVCVQLDPAEPRAALLKPHGELRFGADRVPAGGAHGGHCAGEDADVQRGAELHSEVPRGDAGAGHGWVAGNDEVGGGGTATADCGAGGDEEVPLASGPGDADAKCGEGDSVGTRRYPGQQPAVPYSKRLVQAGGGVQAGERVRPQLSGPQVAARPHDGGRGGLVSDGRAGSVVGAIQLRGGPAQECRGDARQHDQRRRGRSRYLQ